MWNRTTTNHSELCFTNAAIFASKPMRFLSLDEITFRLPVPIGAVLRLSSKVVYTSHPEESPDGEAKVHIMVTAEVEEVETGVTILLLQLASGTDMQLRRETNTFFFTMASEDTGPLGKMVIPSTYTEAMHYLEGKRRLQLGDEMRTVYAARAE
jgi:acyl-coenzyme A thioesterase 9